MKTLYTSHFNKLSLEEQREVLTKMILYGDCPFSFCLYCPIYTKKIPCSLESVKSISTKLFLKLFGSENLFDILL